MLKRYAGFLIILNQKKQNKSTLTLTLRNCFGVNFPGSPSDTQNNYLREIFLKYLFLKNYEFSRVISKGFLFLRFRGCNFPPNYIKYLKELFSQ